mgnify:CR=1 FL=1
MFKYILKIALYAFILNTNFLFAFNKEICAEDLHIFNILNNAKLVLMENIAIANNSNKDSMQDQNQKDGSLNVPARQPQGKPFAQKNIELVSFEQKTLDLVKMEIKLLREIVHGFNEGLLFFVEYRFINVCNFFNNFDSIEPRNIRAFKRKVTKFDNFIQNYRLKKKGLLNKDEVELCEKIINFDQILLTCFLRHDFYNVDMTDEFIDACFFRPVEWVGYHPIITTAFILIIAGCLFYHYVWPHIGNYYYEIVGPDGSKVLDSESSDVTQIRTFFQSGSTCGAHAAFKIIAFHESGGNIERAYDLANDKGRFARLAKEWSEIPAIKKDNVQSLNNLEDIHIQAILNDYNLKNPQSQILPESYSVIPDITHLDMYGDFHGAGDRDLVQQWRGLLNANMPIYFVVNTRKCGVFKEPTRKDGTACSSEEIEKARAAWMKQNQRAVGHWLPFMVIPPKSDGDHVRFLTADSIFNTNRTNCEWVRRLRKMLVE